MGSLEGERVGGFIGVPVLVGGVGERVGGLIGVPVMMRGVGYEVGWNVQVMPSREYAVAGQKSQNLLPG